MLQRKNISAADAKKGFVRVLQSIGSGFPTGPAVDPALAPGERRSISLWFFSTIWLHDAIGGCVPLINRNLVRSGFHRNQGLHGQVSQADTSAPISLPARQAFLFCKKQRHGTFEDLFPVADHFVSSLCKHHLAHATKTRARIVPETKPAATSEG